MKKSREEIKEALRTGVVASCVPANSGTRAAAFHNRSFIQPDAEALKSDPVRCECGFHLLAFAGSAYALCEKLSSFDRSEG
jgi:hypothetical protein